MWNDIYAKKYINASYTQNFTDITYILQIYIQYLAKTPKII